MCCTVEEASPEIVDEVNCNTFLYALGCGGSCTGLPFIELPAIDIEFASPSASAFAVNMDRDVELPCRVL